jgi:hypothetical protein
VEQLDAETVIYDTISLDAHCLAPVAAAVFARADGETSVEKIAAQVAEDLGQPVSTEDVEDALIRLSQAELLDEPQDDRLSSRRQLIRRGATFGAAFAGASLVSVTTITTPVAAAAASCALGKPCTSDGDCGKNIPAGHTAPCQDWSCKCAGVSDNCSAGYADNNPSAACTGNQPSVAGTCCGVCAINSPMGCRCKNQTGTGCTTPGCTGGCATGSDTDCHTIVCTP